MGLRGIWTARCKPRWNRSAIPSVISGVSMVNGFDEPQKMRGEAFPIVSQDALPSSPLAKLLEISLKPDLFNQNALLNH
jgi:hypothetical protein